VGAPLIFDVEGTLIDCATQTITAWQEVLAEHGRHFTHQDLHRYSGMDGKMMLRRLLADSNDGLIETLVKEQGHRYSEKFLPEVLPFSDTTTIVAALARHHRIALATSCNRKELDVYLKRLDITEHVVAAVCGDDVKEGKPSPQLLLAALAALRKVEATGTPIAIGDTPFDAEAAKSAKAVSVGICTGGFSREALLGAGFSSVVADLHGLLEQIIDN